MLPDRAFFDRLADAARAETLPRFRTGIGVANKEAAGFDPVTEGDQAAEAAIRALIERHFPEHGILGEEHGSVGLDREYVWVIDPIDGTRAFISGVPVWGTLIGLYRNGDAVMGLVDQPFTGERFEGGLGRAHVSDRHGERPLAVRKGVALAQATLLSTFPEIGTEAERAAFQRVSRQARLTRYGLDCYGYALLALGQVDLVIEAGLQPYDIVAPIAVIEAAGGIVTDWQGGPAHGGGQVLAAATPELHAAALALLRG